MAVTMVLLFIMYHVTWLVGVLSFKDNAIDSLEMGKAIHVKHTERKGFITVQLSYSFVSLAYLLSFVYILYFLQVSAYVGPFLHALEQMVKDVLKFFCWFSILFLAFSFSFKKLYRLYAQGTKRFQYDSYQNVTRGRQIDVPPFIR